MDERPRRTWNGPESRMDFTTAKPKSKKKKATKVKRRKRRTK